LDSWWILDRDPGYGVKFNLEFEC